MRSPAMKVDTVHAKIRNFGSYEVHDSGCAVELVQCLDRRL